MTHDLDVIIVTYNSAHVIGDLLDSLPKAIEPLSGDIIVVDNGSADDTVEVVAARADARIVRAPNFGYAAGINRGVRAASGAPAILILNPDVRLAEASVLPLLKALQEPRVGIVAPQLRSPAGQLQFTMRHEPSILRALGLSRCGMKRFAEHISDHASYARARTADWAVGAALLMSRECYDAVGGWDESYFLYSEETDICLRARDLGLLTRYEPASVAIHIGGQSGRSDATHAMQVVNRIRLYRRRHGRLAAWIYYCLILGGQFFRLTRGHRECKSGIAAILRPSSRPRQLGCTGQLMPR